jgi:hypothetical protein
MKYFLTAIWTIVCISVLVFSHIHWTKQIGAKAVEPAELAGTTVTKQESSEVDYEKYLQLAANWPETAKDQLKLALKEEKQFKLLFVGSASMEWEKSVTQSLLESFGSERMITVQHTYDRTSSDFVAENKQLELASEKAQLVVIEPFLLNDNGNLKVDDTLANLTKVMEDVKGENPDTTFILQPSHPIYLPKYYSDQIEALKNYAVENNLTYLDHWAAWPATDNPEIKNYLNGDQPNEQGYAAWAQFLVEYFVKN